MKYPIHLFLIAFSGFGFSMELQINNESSTYMYETIMGIRVSDKEGTHINDIQTKELNDSFEKNKYPINDETKRLSAQTGLSEQIILIWFQYKRKKIKTYKPILSKDGFRVNPLYKKENFQQTNKR